MKIDFVIPWVDGNDPEWRAQKNKYSPDKTSDANDARYRDMGILKYWFRAVEAYAPWVNKIHFITCGHLPEWLYKGNPKLNIVNHQDYIPAEYLPTFSSHPIELNIHRINGLSEYFVYFNDDMFLNSSVSEEFFFCKGLPCDYIYADTVYYPSTDDVYAHICTNCIAETNKHFSYKNCMMSNFSKYVNSKYGLKNIIKNIAKLGNYNCFTGIDDHHLPAPYLKQTFCDAWEESFETLDKTSMNKFRGPFDVSQSVIRYRQLAEGNFTPVEKTTRGRIVPITEDPQLICNLLDDENCKMICINDSLVGNDFEYVKNIITSAFDKKFPQKSSFEK